jgi:hypothetical protein
LVGILALNINHVLKVIYVQFRANCSGNSRFWNAR